MTIHNNTLTIHTEQKRTDDEGRFMNTSERQYKADLLMLALVEPEAGRKSDELTLDCGVICYLESMKIEGNNGKDE